MKLTSAQVLDLARGLDAAHTFAFREVTVDIDPASMAAVSIMVAGFIAGRAEVALSADSFPEGDALYAKAKEMGRDAALKAKAARG